MQWYIYADGAQSGPHSEDALFAMARDGRLMPTAHVWNTGMGDQWILASAVPGLFPAPPPTAPPPLLRVRPSPTVGAGEVYGSPRLSLTEPAGRAWHRMKDLLFRPFDMARWFALGFSAWLATLGEQGGGGFNGSSLSQDAQKAGDPVAFLEGLRDKVLSHLPLIIAIGSVVIVLSLAIGVVFTWLRCRGKFMFLDNVVRNRTEISRPWRAFRRHGNSLFLWVLVYGLVAMAVICLLLVIAVLTFGRAAYHQGGVGGLIGPLAANVVLWVIIGTILAYLSRFLEDFVVPIMYRDALTATEAWRRLLPLFKAHTGDFVLYGLFYLLLSLLAGAAILVAVVLTCCVAGCLVAIPLVGGYLASVLFLPVMVYLRLFSLEYLAQFGTAFEMQPGDGDSA